MQHNHKFGYIGFENMSWNNDCEHKQAEQSLAVNVLMTDNRRNLTDSGKTVARQQYKVMIKLSHGGAGG